MKKLLLSICVVGAAAFAVAGPASAGSTQAHDAASKSIKVGDNYFVRPGARPTVSVKKGTTLHFVWAGHAPHDVTVVSGPAKFRSGTAKFSGTYNKVVSKKGTYSIICTVHGAAMGLVVKVK